MAERLWYRYRKIKTKDEKSRPMMTIILTGSGLLCFALFYKMIDVFEKI